MSAPAISIIIPAYNERERLPPYLDEWIAYFAAKEGRGEKEEWELVVVDDGSSDGTAEFVEQRAEETGAPFRVLRQPKNAGKGAAICRGMTEALGARRLFADADGATPAAELAHLDEHYDMESAPVQIGSRVQLAGKNAIERKMMRHYSGRLFATAVSLVSGLRLYDTQCGFKLFSAEAADTIFSQVKTAGWAFDVEVLLLAQRHGFAIREVPVNWREIPGSKISTLRAAPRMLWDVWRARTRHGKAKGNPKAAKVGS